MHIYRWDLDKTYLQTDFDSIRGLVRSATEPASAKTAVPGARALLRALAASDSARVHIVSGSPTQMRQVLAEKLELDGIKFDSLVLKDNLGNLKRGRLRAIRGQFGYKLPELLKSRIGIGKAVRETLFGDDAEVDALVYSVYADVLSGELRPRQLRRMLHAAGAYDDRIDIALQAVDKLATTDAVDRIFIRRERRVPDNRFAPLGPRVVPVASWWQAALCLLHAGHIDGTVAGEVLDEVLAAEPGGAWALAALTQDVVRRGHVPAEVIDAIEADPQTIASFKRALGRLGSTRPAAPQRARRVDYVDLLKSFGRSESRDDAG